MDDTESKSGASSQSVYFSTQQYIDGILYPHFVHKDHLEKLKSFRLRPDDVFIGSYPKSGTHWLMKIVYLIIRNGEDKYLNVTPSREEVVWIESSGKPGHKNLEDRPDPRVYASHSYYSRTAGGPPNTSTAKHIYCARNPKDVSVSLYHHHINRKSTDDKIGFDFTWDEFFECFMKGTVSFGSWWDHVPEWWAHKDEPNVLFLKYEDMKKDLPTNVKKIADFLGRSLDQETIEKIAQATTIDSMRMNTTEWKEEHYFRKGVVGDWEHTLTTAQSAIMDARYHQAVEGTGLVMEFR